MTCGRVARCNMATQLTTIILWLGGSVLGLRDIQLSVPEAVGVGSSATLGCRWALDVGETLYTVKWYHGAQEFFRFVPKELPNTRVFSQTGISVDVSRSGAQQVVLRGVSRGLSGRYRCEVSADAPFFHTVYKSANMRVVELPETGPSVRAQKSWYSIGDMLRANCTSPPADPPANLTWLLNGQEVKGLDIPLHDTSYARRKPVITDTSLEDANRIIFSPWDAISGYEEPVTDNVIDIPGNIDDVVGIPHADNERKNKEDSTTRLAPRLEQIANKLNISIEEEKSNKSSSFSQLVIRVQSVHFRKGRVNVTCVAHVLSVWSNSGVLILDEERPQIAPVMGSRDSNSGLRRSTSHVGVLAILNCLLYRHWMEALGQTGDYNANNSSVYLLSDVDLTSITSLVSVLDHCHEIISAEGFKHFTAAFCSHFTPCLLCKCIPDRHATSVAVDLHGYVLCKRQLSDNPCLIENTLYCKQ